MILLFDQQIQRPLNRNIKRGSGLLYFVMSERINIDVHAMQLMNIRIEQTLHI